MVIQMCGVTKTFGPIIANDKIDFAVDRGEIVGLLGENGAGKTTLMNILYGMYPPDSGMLVINGKPVYLKSPRDAIHSGIGMVHQHFMLVPSFTVTENVVFGTEGERFLGSSGTEAVEHLAEEHGLTVSSAAIVGKLPVGQCQQVEILKMLYRNAQVLIFDEPTSLLTPQEADLLFDSMRAIAATGRAIVFITHKLDEVFSVSTRVVVLRRGRVVFQSDTAHTDKDQVSHAMVAQEITKAQRDASPVSGQDQSEVVLWVDDLSARNDQGLPALNNLSFRIHRGEILGVAGVSGNGQTELAEVITRLRPVSTGRISLLGEDATHKSTTWAQNKIAHIPESRLATGIAPTMTVGENLGMKEHTKFCTLGMLNRRALFSWGKEMIQQFKISTPSINARAANLSGGNLQRVILARELSRGTPMIVAAYPTRGLDIAGTEYARQLLLEQRKAGSGILLISEDLDELFSLSDRIAVLYRGKIVHIAPTRELNLRQVGRMMMGQQVSAEQGETDE